MRVTAADRRRRRTRSAVGTVVVIAAVLLAALAAIARQWLLSGLLVATFAVAAAGTLAWLSDLPGTAPPDTAVHIVRFAVPDAHDERINVLSRNLTFATSNIATFTEAVQPTLAKLADDALRARYGISMSTSPDAARARLGEDLWLRLTTAPDRPLLPEELRHIVWQVRQLSALS